MAAIEGCVVVQRGGRNEIIIIHTLLFLTSADGSSSIAVQLFCDGLGESPPRLESSASGDAICCYRRT